MSAGSEYTSMGGLLLLPRSQVGRHLTGIAGGHTRGGSKILLEERLLLRRKGDAKDQRGIRKQGNAICQ